MLNFAANLSFLFLAHPFINRFSAAAEAGFNGCEFLFPYEFDAKEMLKQELYEKISYDQYYTCSTSKVTKKKKKINVNLR